MMMTHCYLYVVVHVRKSLWCMCTELYVTRKWERK